MIRPPHHKALIGLRGVIKLSHAMVKAPAGAKASKFTTFRPLGFDRFAGALAGGVVTYSYTQIAQYLACPLRYRYRYLDGWQEKETRAGLLFGRAFEQALAALFRREDPGCALFEAWSHYKNSPLEYPKSETWDQMLALQRLLLELVFLVAKLLQLTLDDRQQIVLINGLPADGGHPLLLKQLKSAKQFGEFRRLAGSKKPIDLFSRYCDLNETRVCPQRAGATDDDQRNCAGNVCDL